MTHDIASRPTESWQVRGTVLRCVVMALLGCAACGGHSPTTSSEPPATAFTAGRYSLSINGPQGLQGCQSPYDQFFLSARTVFLSLSQEGSDWVARQDATPGADVVLRIHESPSNGRLSSVSGTIQGTMVAVVGFPDGVALGATFDGAIPVSGMSLTGAGHADGTFSGSVTFIDTQRPPMLCPSGEWRLSKLPF